MSVGCGFKSETFNNASFSGFITTLLLSHFVAITATCAVSVNSLGTLAHAMEESICLDQGWGKL